MNPRNKIKPQVHEIPAGTTINLRPMSGKSWIPILPESPRAPFVPKHETKNWRFPRGTDHEQARKPHNVHKRRNDSTSVNRAATLRRSGQKVRSKHGVLQINVGGRWSA